MLAVLVVVVAAVSLTFGAAGVAPADVLAALVGRADRLTSFVILDLRLPRLLAAVLVGACLGISGGLFQSVARNPLASPDIIGITTAASATGAVALVWFGITGLALSGVVLGGTLVAAVLIYLLAWRNGVSGYRFVLVGIGFAAICAGLVSYVLTRADLRDVQQALVWITGSLNSIDDVSLTVLAVSAVVLVPAALLVGRPLAALGLGDDVAAGLGVRPERLQPVADGPLEFDIELAEPLGADTLLHGRFGEARELVTVRQGGHVQAKPGEKRRFRAEPGHLHVFDLQTGKRIADAG